MRRQHLALSVVCLVALLMAVVPAAAAGFDASAVSQSLNSITYGQTTTGTVGEEDPTRDNPRPSANDHSGTWYYEPVTFDGTAGEVVRIDLQSAGSDTVVVLVAPDGDTVAVNEDGGDGNDSLLVHRLDETGEYTIQVTNHYPETSFEYSLSLTELEALYEPDPTSMDGEGRIVGRISDSDPQLARFNGHHENVTFSGDRGETATVSLVSPVDSELRLYGPDGARVAADIEDASGRNARLRAELPADGVYTVVAGSNGGADEYDFVLSVEGVRRAVSDGDDDYSGTFAEFDVVSLSMNRSTAYHGQPVRVDARVENYGNKGETYTGLLLLDQERVATRDVYLPAGEAQNVTFVVSADETESYEVFLKTEHVGTLDVEPRPPATVEMRSARDSVRGIVRHGRANSSLTMALPASNTTADFESLTLSFAALTPRFDVVATSGARQPTANATTATGEPNVTAAGAIGDATNVTSVANATTVTDATPPPLPNGARSVGRLRMSTPNATALDRVANATVSFSLAKASVDDTPGTVVVYHYEGAGDWAAIEPTLVNETGERYQYRAPIDTVSLYAVGIERPVFEVTEVRFNRTAPPSRNVTASAVVRNEGALAGTFRLPLRVDNRTVSTANVSLEPGASTAVSFDRRFETAGTYRVSLGNRTRELVVQSTPSATPTDSSASSAQQSTTVEPAQEPGAGTATTASGPGFGGLTAVVAVLFTTLLVATRLRD
jgi:hypothetical protein